MSKTAAATQNERDSVGHGHFQRPTNKGEKTTEMSLKAQIAEWIRNNANAVIALFTVVIAAIALLQALIYKAQLRTMRIDQRGWLKFEAAPDKPGDETVSWQISSGKPVSYPLRVVNTGKTPVTNVDMRIYVDIVKAEEEPLLDRVDGGAYPHGHITSGIIFPNSDFKQVVFKPLADTGFHLATDDEVGAIRDGKAYLAVYGIITYDDVFKTHRWTRFCAWVAGTGKFQASRCTKYNAVDDN